MTARLVLLRHGQSEYNRLNLFTGFIDAKLSEQGRAEAMRAQKALSSFDFAAVFCSVLSRAIETATLALPENCRAQRFFDAALNERHYGDLQGKNKDELKKLYGPEQIQLWRRSYLEKPPGGESLKDTYDRVIPYYLKEIKPWLSQGKTVLICAHGNSLRALVKALENISDKDICKVEIATGIPIVYDLDNDGSIIDKKIIAD